MSKVETTRIEKKYKDKKTGEYRTIVINYAKVVDRLNAFWKENPRGKIETSSRKDGDQVTFKTFILADKSNEFSREATGHAYGTIGDEKAFEKLETISIGRALALIGYAVTGDIASDEEMEEFAKFKDDKVQEAILELEACTTLEELKTKFLSLGNLMTDSRVVQTKDRRKVELNASTALTTK